MEVEKPRGFLYFSFFEFEFLLILRIFSLIFLLPLIFHSLNLRICSRFPLRSRYIFFCIVWKLLYFQGVFRKFLKNGSRQVGFENRGHGNMARDTDSWICAEIQDCKKFIIFKMPVSPNLGKNEGRSRRAWRRSKVLHQRVPLFSVATAYGDFGWGWKNGVFSKSHYVAMAWNRNRFVAFCLWNNLWTRHFSTS